MWRQSAIRDLLLEEICNLPRTGESTPEAADDREGDDRLHKARRRAVLVVAISWAAVLALFLLRSPDQAWLPLGPAEDSIFTLGILALAIHSGFRLGQLEKLRAVARLLEDLKDRTGRD